VGWEGWGGGRGEMLNRSCIYGATEGHARGVCVLVCVCVCVLGGGGGGRGVSMRGM
jgi:hypothetical protein